MYKVWWGPIRADTEIQKGATISIGTDTSNEGVLTIFGGATATIGADKTLTNNGTIQMTYDTDIANCGIFTGGVIDQRYDGSEVTGKIEVYGVTGFTAINVSGESPVTTRAIEDIAVNDPKSGYGLTDKKISSVEYRKPTFLFNGVEQDLGPVSLIQYTNGGTTYEITNLDNASNAQGLKNMVEGFGVKLYQEEIGAASPTSAVYSYVESGTDYKIIDLLDGLDGGVAVWLQSAQSTIDNINGQTIDASLYSTKSMSDDSLTPITLTPAAGSPSPLVLTGNNSKLAVNSTAAFDIAGANALPDASSTFGAVVNIKADVTLTTGTYTFSRGYTVADDCTFTAGNGVTVIG